MKLIKTLLLFFSVTLFGQGNSDTLQLYGRKNYEEVEKIMEEYYQLQIHKDIFIYRKSYREAYGLYIRAKYDSLLRNTKQKDSIILANSILKLKYRDHIYVKYQPDLFHEVYKLNKYNKNNKLLEIITYMYKNRTIRIDDYINITSFTYSNDSSKLDNLSYTFSKYKSINENNNFDDPLYIKTVNQDGRVLVRNYEKDFPISKDEILKHLPEKFYEEAPKLMKGKKYSYDQKDWSQELTAKNAKLESEEFKLLIRKEEVRLDKLYSENNVPFYEVIIVGSHRKHWLLKINPKTGDINHIELSTVIE
ncbi:hypothetical protein ACM39_03585 [Chryseobacterium sp. FH2]|uniref:hypothetical protein n=1 Tax=Chryseobacterium sp. FH2 TaxID=1674291 RepID=UPI00065A9C79|nr:hypothetical protein [Chryseobacterium sp. FH2]KMQ69197.1 hypothetical protein ACM39_03585 [Chryseobacterium sp. FH2]